jgi:hypothetical protein
MPDLEISPKSATLGVGQTLRLAALKKDGTPDPTVAWSIHGAGTIDAKDGIYKPPPRIYFASRVVVVARPSGGGEAATAEIELVSVAFWTQIIGSYLLFCFFSLVTVLIFLWSFFCPTCRPDVVRVSPPWSRFRPGRPRCSPRTCRSSGRRR